MLYFINKDRVATLRYCQQKKEKWGQNMSYGIVHMQKIKRGALSGIQSHNNREHKSKTNPDIDYEKTKDNDYLLHQDNYYKFIKDTVENLASKTKTIRKDAVLMCNFVITSDHEKIMSMSENERKDFFQDSFNFFSDRYGYENIVYATVHNDEYTPHLHLGVIPIKDEKLSAKNLFTRTELRNLQTDFHKQVGSRYGMERGVEGSEKKHLTELELKIQTKTEKLKELDEKISQSKNSLKKLADTRKTLLNDLEDINITQAEINALEARKTPLGAIKGITLDDIDKLKKKANMGVKSGIENRILKDKVAQLMVENEKLNSRMPSILERAKEMSTLKNENNRLKKIVELIPENILQKIQEILLSQKKNKTKKIGRER